MILFHNIVEIFDLADFYRGAVLRIVALNGRFIGRTAIDGDLLRHAVAADRLREEPLGGWLIALLCQQEINGLTGLIDRAIEVIPLTFDLDVGLVHPPTDQDRTLATMECLFQLGAVFQVVSLNVRDETHPNLGTSIRLHATDPSMPLRRGRTAIHWWSRHDRSDLPPSPGSQGATCAANRIPA